MRGQYDGYRQEKDVAADSDVETFCALRLHIDSWRWAGVPWYLRSGKLLPTTAAEVLVQLKPPPQRCSTIRTADGGRANYVRFKLQPVSAVALAARVKRPGKGFVGDQRELYLCEEALSEGSTYERLLGDAMAGDGALFTEPGRGRGGLGGRRPGARRPSRRAALCAGQLGPGGSRRADRRRRRLAQPDGRKEGPAAMRREGPPMTDRRDVVFLLDVDNTLLDNDRIIADLREHLEREFGVASSDRYWAIFEELRSELGYADYLGALQRYRAEVDKAAPVTRACCSCRASSSTIRSPIGSTRARSTSSPVSAGSGRR